MKYYKFEEYIRSSSSNGGTDSCGPHDNDFYRQGFCIHCNKSCSNFVAEEGRVVLYHHYLSYCLSCGFWDFQTFISDYSSDYELLPSKHNFRAIFKRTEQLQLDSLDVPIELLKQYLFFNPKGMLGVHPKKMELLVGDVFRDYFDCEVRHVGGSNDGGVDLYAVMSDRPFAIQVKRRSSLNKAERVGVIREFIGAMTLKQVKDGIFVTTADKFSKASIESANKSIEIGHMNSFRLVDFSSFVSMMRMTSSKMVKPKLPYMSDYFWTKILNKIQL